MRSRSRWTVSFVVLIPLIFVCQSALACGGFFCSNFPMNQIGEKIVFDINDEDVTAIIQIQFAGDAEDFSWILPLPSPPQNEGGMEVSTEELFVQAINRTDPTFTINWTGVDQCMPYWGMEDEFAVNATEDAGGAGGGAVEVLQVKEVGPYTASVVKSDDPEALSAWLKENDYEQPPEADQLIAHYVAQENVFLALKLQQNKGAGDIAPIKVTFTEPEGACIPLILTAIAADPDMPVFAWILDESRVVPKNFFNVGINFAKIDWVNGGSNYIDVVTEAVNEAAGHGFVTEYAGAADIMKESLYWEGRFDAVDNLVEFDHPRDFYSAFINSGVPSNTQTLALLEQFIPVPEYYDGDPMNFYNEVPWNDDHKEYLDSLEFDAAAFVAAIDEIIIQPIIDAQEMLDSKPYLTRIFTTISPEEMDRDPIFVNAPELGDVSNNHIAEGTGTCSGEGGFQISGVQLTLPDGTVIDVDGEWSNWNGPNFAENASVDGSSVGTLPSASSIAVVQEDGSLKTVPTDMVDFEDQQMGLAPELGNRSQNIPDAQNMEPGTTDSGPSVEDSGAATLETAPSAAESGGCNQGANSSALPGVLLLGAIVLATRRREHCS